MARELVAVTGADGGRIWFRPETVRFIKGKVECGDRLVTAVSLVDEMGRMDAHWCVDEADAVAMSVNAALAKPTRQSRSATDIE